MEIVLDTSSLLAVITAEPERNRLVELTAGHVLIGPACIPWEIGNAFSAMFKQHRISLETAMRGFKIFEAIPLRLVQTDIAAALAIASQTKIYAYDSYFLECAKRHGAPLLTLDRALKRTAHSIGIRSMEI